MEIINCATKINDKAMIVLLWDTGARIGEIGTLRIRHIKFDELGAIVNVKGKTGFLSYTDADISNIKNDAPYRIYRTFGTLP